MKCPTLPLMASQIQEHENTQRPRGARDRLPPKHLAGCTLHNSLEANLAIILKYLNNTQPFDPTVFLSVDSKEIIRDMAAKMFDIA